jgi:hypothetical protein
VKKLDSKDFYFKKPSAPFSHYNMAQSNVIIKIRYNDSSQKILSFVCKIPVRKITQERRNTIHKQEELI